MNKEKLAKVIKDNAGSPIIIYGIGAGNLKNAIIVPADIPSSQLGAIPGANGFEFPKWLEEIYNSASKKAILLAITDIDSVPFDEQEKFIGILKYFGVNGYSFPSQTRIVLTAKANAEAQVSPRIRQLCIAIKAEEKC